MVKWYQFKKLYSLSNTNKYLFYALIADKETYRIIFDKNNVFTKTFLSIISGNCKLYKPKTETADYHNSYEEILIQETDAISNLRKYIELTKMDNVPNNIIMEETPLINLISYKLKGPDFSYANGMEPSAFNKVNKIVHKISRAIKKHYDDLEQFEFQKAGSLIYEFYTLENSNLSDIRNMLNGGIFNNSKYNDTILQNELFIYKLAKYLYEIKSINNLDSLEISILDDEPVEVNMENIETLYNRLNNSNIVKQGIPDRYSVKDKSFKINKYSCYLDDSFDNEILIRLKNKIDNGEEIEVSGISRPNHDFTIDVQNIKFDI